MKVGIVPNFTREKTYSVTSEVIKYLRTKGVQATRNVHGQKMYITIKSIS